MDKVHKLKETKNVQKKREGTRQGTDTVSKKGMHINVHFKTPLLSHALTSIPIISRIPYGKKKEHEKFLVKSWAIINLPLVFFLFTR